MDDFYDLLEVSEDASPADIKRAWRGKAGEYHPDVNDDDRANAQFKTLRKAYEVLSDETERAAYDRLGHRNYVNKRLDGLPTSGMTRPNGAASGGNRWDTGTANSRASSAGGSTTTSSNTGRGGSNASSSTSSASSSARTNRSSTSSGRSRSSGSSRSTGSTSRGSTSARTTGGRSGRSESSRRRGSSGRRSNANANGTSSTASAGSNASTTGTAEAGTTAATDTESSPRHPLWYGWVVTFLVGVAYVGSLGVYLAANAGALSSFAAALLANPQAALLGAGGMTAPGTFVLDAVAATPGVALAFPVGVALLTVVFTGVVAKFGHGTAYLYLLGALAPAAAMAVGPVVPPLSTAGTLALVLVLPFLATTLFLADVGRFLASTR